MTRLGLVIFISLFLFPVPLLAANSAATTTTRPHQGQRLRNLQDRVENRQASRAAQRETRQDRRCEVITASIDTRITNFQNNKQRHLELYQRMSTRLQNAIDRLSAKGFDTTQLKTDLQMLNTKINQYVADYTAFIDKLRATKQHVCGESQGAFRNALAEARAQRQIAQASRRAIIEFYRTVIRKDIRELRQQKLTPTP